MSGTKARQTRRRQPKQRRAQSTVSAIVKGAAQVLAECGWAGFNTNVVAERAGVSIGSLYEYFPNKQAIADAIVSEHLAKGEQLLSVALTNTSVHRGLETLVTSLVEGFVTLHRDDPRLHRVLSSEVPLSDEARARADALRHRVVALVVSALEGHSNNPKLTAQVIVETVDALTHRWFAEENANPVSPETMASELGRMLSAYLALVARAHKR